MKKKIIKLEDFGSLQDALAYLKALDLGKGWEIEVRPAKDSRTLPQNDLYWMWCSTAAKHFSTEEAKYTKNDMHDIFCHKFLGYTDGKIIGTTEFKPELRSTTGLKVDEMHEYMNKVEVWCAEHGLLLPTPADSQYDKKKRKNGSYD